MKKRTINGLTLNKKTISSLAKLSEIKGGAQYSTDCWTDILTSVIIECPEPEPWPIDHTNFLSCPYLTACI